MVEKKKSVTGVMTILSVGTNKTPKGSVFTEWDILFESTVSLKKRTQIIDRLLNKIVKFKVKDKTITTSLKYQSFKAETNDNLYILRVYRQFKKPATRSAKPAGDILNIVSEGPIRTPGPPLPRPPAGVISISDTVGLDQDVPALV